MRSWTDRAARASRSRAGRALRRARSAQPRRWPSSGTRASAAARSTSSPPGRRRCSPPRSLVALWRSRAGGPRLEHGGADRLALAYARRRPRLRAASRRTGSTARPRPTRGCSRSGTTCCRSAATRSAGCSRRAAATLRLLRWVLARHGGRCCAVGIVDVYAISLQWWRDSGAPGWFREQLGLDYDGLSGLPENFVYNPGDERPLRRLVSTFLSPLATSYLLVVSLLLLAARRRAEWWAIALGGAPARRARAHPHAGRDPRARGRARRARARAAARGACSARSGGRRRSGSPAYASTTRSPPRRASRRRSCSSPARPRRPRNRARPATRSAPASPRSRATGRTCATESTTSFATRRASGSATRGSPPSGAARGRARVSRPTPSSASRSGCSARSSSSPGTSRCSASSGTARPGSPRHSRRCSRSALQTDVIGVHWLAIVLWGLCGAAVGQEYDRAAMSERTITTPDGRALRVYEAGDPAGHADRAIYGTPSGGMIYERHAEDAHAKGIRFVTFDRPGYGGSDPRPDRSIADVVEDVTAIADELELRPLRRLGRLRRRPARARVRGAATRPRPGRRQPRLGRAVRLRGARLDSRAWARTTSSSSTPCSRVARRSSRSSRSTAPSSAAAGPDDLRAQWATLLSPADAAVVTSDFADLPAREHEHGARSRRRRLGRRRPRLRRVRGASTSRTSARRSCSGRASRTSSCRPSHGRWLAAHIPGVEAHISADDGHLTLIEHRVPEVHAWLLERL